LDKINFVLLVACLVGIGYIIYFQQGQVQRQGELSSPLVSKLKDCSDQAVQLEKRRHPNDLLTTDEDVSLYMKNVIACVTAGSQSRD